MHQGEPIRVFPKDLFARDDKNLSFLPGHEAPSLRLQNFQQPCPECLERSTD